MPWSTQRLTPDQGTRGVGGTKTEQKDSQVSKERSKRGHPGKQKYEVYTRVKGLVTIVLDREGREKGGAVASQKKKKKDGSRIEALVRQKTLGWPAGRGQKVEANINRFDL